MANFDNIKREIDQNVNTNGVQAITGAILNKTLKDMLQEVDEAKQDTLVAGEGIVISGNTISATGGGSGVSYTAGNGIDISGNVISADLSDLAGEGLMDDGQGHLAIDPNVVQEKLVSGQNLKTINGNSLLGSGDIVIQGGGGGNYLPLTGGTLQDTSTGDTELKVIDGSDEDYVKIVAPETGGERPHVEIFENGSGDTKYYYDSIQRGAETIQIPLASGTLALTSDIPSSLWTSGTGTDSLLAPRTASSGGTATRTGAISAGYQTNATGDNSVAFGNGNNTAGNNSISAGQTNRSTGTNSATFGRGVNAYTEQEIALGQYNRSFTSNDPSVANVLSVGNGQSALHTSNALELKKDGDLYIQDLGGFDGTNSSSATRVQDIINGKQDALDSGVNIKTINGNSLLGSGDIQISGGGATYSAGSGISIDSNNTISVKTSITGGITTNYNGELLVNHDNTLTQDYNGRLSVNTSSLQKKLTAGNGINIDDLNPGINPTISVDASDLAGNGLSVDGNGALQVDTTVVQEKLVAGNNITISGNVISATGGGSGGSYTAGNGIDISGNTISVDASDLAGTGLTSDLNGHLNVDPNTLAGAGLRVDSNGALEVVGGGSGSGLWTSGTGSNSLLSVPAQDSTGTASGAFSISSGFDTDATGDYSVALGYKATAGTTYSFAAGKQPTASGTSSVALGDLASATGGYSVALGSNANASGTRSFATSNANATNTDSIALGNDATAGTGIRNVAIGTSTLATNNDEVATGKFNKNYTGGTDSENTSFTIGNGTSNSTRSNVVEIKKNNDIYVVGVGGFDGTNSSSSTTLQDAIRNGGGSGTSYQAGSGIEISDGYISTVVDTNTFAYGNMGEIILDYPNVSSTLAGSGLATDGQGAMEVDYVTASSNLAGYGLSDAQGAIDVDFSTISSTLAGNGLSDAQGSLEVDTSVIQEKLTAGNNITISGNVISATGGSGTTYQAGSGIDITGGTISVDTSTIQEKLVAGNNITISGNTISASGGSGTSYWTSGTGTGSILPLGGDQLTSSGTGSIAIGYGATASGDYSFAHSSATASGDHSFAIEGGTASGTNSIALGGNASGTGSGAVGLYSSASAQASLAIGLGTQATNQGESAYGTFNLSTTSATPSQATHYSIGLGTAQARRNELEVKQNSDAYLIGVGGYDGTNSSSAQSLQTVINSKQNQLVSGVDIKTINGQSIVGGGDLVISGGGASYTAGTGISIDSNNVITNTAPDPGLWVAGSGSSSIKSKTATGAGGTRSIAIGDMAEAIGIDSIAIGYGAQAFKRVSLALGKASAAHGENSVAILGNTENNAESSVAIGYMGKTTNPYEIGLGKFNKSIGTGTTAEKTQFTVGNGSYSNEKNVLEIKQNNDTYLLGVGGFDGTNASSAQTLQTVINSKQNQLVSGVDIKTINGQSIVGGGNLVISGGSGSSLWTSGTGTDSLVAPATITAGLSNDPASGVGAISCGYDTNAIGDYSFAQGAQALASGLYSAAFNNGTASGDYSAAFGTSGADRDYSFAAGNGSVAMATNSIALASAQTNYDDSDPNDIKDAEGSVAIGNSAYTYGRYSVALGSGAQATGENSVAIGINARATGENSVALLSGETQGFGSIAMGFNAHANAENSIAILGGCTLYDGTVENVINAQYSMAVGRYSTTEGENSVAMAGGAARGENSLAVGVMSEVLPGSTSNIALGYGVLSGSSIEGEVALGKYNWSDGTQVFSVGCGRSVYHDPSDADFTPNPDDPENPDQPWEELVRENAITIDADGNIFIKGLGGYLGQDTSGATSLQDLLSNI